MATCEGCGATGDTRVFELDPNLGPTLGPIGAPACDACWKNLKLGTLIRSRRAAQAGPVVKDADGVEIRVGDWVNASSFPNPVQVLRIEHKPDHHEVWAHWTDQDRETWLEPESCHHVPSPSQPAEAGGDVGSGFKVGDRVRHKLHGWLGTVVGLHGSGGGELKVKRDDGANVDGHNGGYLGWARSFAKTTGGSGDAATREDAGEGLSSPGLASSAQPPVDSIHFGPDVYPANPAYAIAAEREASVVDVAASPLAAFTAAVEKHLVPRLPKGLRVVTDVVERGQLFQLWVLDEDGRELTWSKYLCDSWELSEEELTERMQAVASALMAEKARAK